MVVNWLLISAAWLKLTLHGVDTQQLQFKRLADLSQNGRLACHRADGRHDCVWPPASVRRMPVGRCRPPASRWPAAIGRPPAARRPPAPHLLAGRQQESWLALVIWPTKKPLAAPRPPACSRRPPPAARQSPGDCHRWLPSGRRPPALYPTASILADLGDFEAKT